MMDKTLKLQKKKISNTSVGKNIRKDNIWLLKVSREGKCYLNMFCTSHFLDLASLPRISRFIDYS